MPTQEEATNEANSIFPKVKVHYIKISFVPTRFINKQVTEIRKDQGKGWSSIR